MKKLFSKPFIFLGACLLLFLGLAACAHPKQKELVEVLYRVNAEGRGRIEGVDTQYRYAGEDCSPVAAVAEYGYVFSRWSDGLESAARTDTNIKTDMLLIAYFEKDSFSVNYEANYGGYIKGNSSQNVLYLENSQEVEAVPERGYMFVGWSDGETSPVRKDFDIIQDFSVTALFDRLEKTYTYDYNYATKNNDEKNVTLHIDKLEEASFPVPEKDYSIFGGWYADKERTVPIADEQGKLLAGTELFYFDTDTFYAKWTAKENITYKILMVFVNEVQATLTARDGRSVEVNYTLSPTERKICELIASQFSKMLNEIFYGYLTVEVDSYFTKEPVRTEMFDLRKSNENINYELNAYNIHEVAPKLRDYRSVLTSYTLNDYNEYYFHAMTGLAERKYGEIYLDKKFYAVTLNGDPLEVLLNTEDKSLWDMMLSTYLHEFTHTIESDQGYYEYHKVLSQSLGEELKLTKLYLLNQMVMDGETVGVPHEYWIGEVYTNARYWAKKGGKISSSLEKQTTQIWQEVYYGGTADTITATADPGYRFVKWSDGVTTPERTDSNITSFLEVWAIFEKIES